MSSLLFVALALLLLSSAPINLIHKPSSSFPPSPRPHQPEIPILPLVPQLHPHTPPLQPTRALAPPTQFPPNRKSAKSAPVHLFDHNSNAYILFYTRIDGLGLLLQEQENLPAPIDQSVRRQNVEFMHIRSQFSSNNLRGDADEWLDIIMPYLKVSKVVRFWFATNALFRDPHRIAEYLLECPSSDVRTTFSKLLIAVAHFSRNDGPFIPMVPIAGHTRMKNKYLAEYVLDGVLNLLRRDVSEYGRHLAQYFGFFVNYINLGDMEKRHLVERDVPATFINLALGDGPALPIKYEGADLSKLYKCVGLLVLLRCFAPLQECGSRGGGRTWSKSFPTLSRDSRLSGPYSPSNRGRPSLRERKILDDAYAAEDTVQLLQFLSWENPTFSQDVVSKILGRISFSYETELKTFLEILISLLRIGDSWQFQRITNALEGLPEHGLMDTLDRNQTDHPEKSAICIESLSDLLEKDDLGQKVLQASPELSRKWNLAVDWLQRRARSHLARPTSMTGERVGPDIDGDVPGHDDEMPRVRGRRARGDRPAPIKRSQRIIDEKV
ncbi:putative ubiquitin carboxyl-terminal hydrolase FAF-Y [Folsomia candida]|uniref:Putative ubiquitin carboxyl-terminal hydrolase FAF-Y n=1 Tax=Folsomia candida TaxID=158441 RepID=A0A226DL11_FOLCA|nr:putative ubiquitin carboxyl-terminal hydrolase FAF-Y [Folsomia candida]